MIIKHVLLHMFHLVGGNPPVPGNGPAKVTLLFIGNLPSESARLFFACVRARASVRVFTGRTSERREAEPHWKQPPVTFPYTRTGFLRHILLPHTFLRSRKKP